MKIIKRCSHPFFLLICFFLFNITVNAGSANLSLNGSNSVYVGKNVDVTIALNNINASGGIMGVQFKIDYDTNILEYVSSAPMASFGVSYANNVKTVAGISINPASNIMSASSNIIKLTFRTKAEGNAYFKITQVEVTEGNNTIASVGTTSKTISVLPPPSTNAALASLTVSEGSLSFNKSTTTYNIEVADTTANINIDARAEDSGAKVAGTGAKTLKYGNNSFSIIVTAPSGDKLTYVVNVNRKDNRSKNTNLSTLTIDGVTFSPGFSPNTTTYTAKVPFEVENLTVHATPEDSKSKVAISGQTKLEAEKVRNVTIKVTAENGDTKTYTVKVTRGKDPNKPKNNNNYLAYITPSAGVLSPEFNREVLEYNILVPSEITTIEFTTVPEDEVFGEVKITGPDKLSIGENVFTFEITAEDGTQKVYKVTVTRERSKTASESTLLKEINLENAVLDKDFDKNLFVYRLKNIKGDVKIEGIPEDENNRVSYFQEDGIIVISVIDGEGNSSVYIFLPKEKGNNALVIILGIIAAASITTGLFIGYKLGTKKFKTKKLNDQRDITKAGDNPNIQRPIRHLDEFMK